MDWYRHSYKCRMVPVAKRFLKISVGTAKHKKGKKRGQSIY